MTTSRMCGILLSLVVTTAAFSQESQWTRVLFPVVLYEPIPGAHGSLWRTTVSAVNTGTEDVRLAGAYVCMMCRRPEAGRLVPSITYSYLPSASGYTPGTFVVLDSRLAHTVRFGLTARDVSRDDRSLGVEVPVVHEAEFRADRIALTGIPRDDRYRLLLRVYSLERGGTVTVRGFQQAGGVVNDSFTPDSVLGEITIPLQWETDFREPTSRPGYAQLSELPLDGLERNKLARLDIVPSPGLHIWAFVTITNNETQAVTIISPH